MLPVVIAIVSQFSSQRPVDAVIRDYMNAAHRNGVFNGTFAVSVGDKAICSGALGYSNFEMKTPLKVADKFRIASISKAILNVVVLQLVDEGKLDLDKTFDTYLPGYSKSWGNRVTIRQMLTHTSGIPNFGSDADFFEKAQFKGMSDTEFYQRIANHKLLFEPGSSFSYSNDAINAVSLMVERVTKRPYLQEAQDRVLTPAKMTDTVFANTEAFIPNRVGGYVEQLTGVTNAPFYRATPSGGYYSTVGDLQKLCHAIEKGTILSKAMRELIWAEGPKQNPYGWSNYKERFGTTASYKLSVTDGSVFGFLSVLIYVPERKLTISILTNLRSSRVTLFEIAKALVSIESGLPAEALKPSLAKAVYGLFQAGKPTPGNQLLATNAEKYWYSEQDMTELGYEFLKTKRERVAHSVFSWIVSKYPKSANAYDSLGEAEAALGNTKEAIANYRKSLELDPSNKNAEEMIKKLGG